MWLERIISLIGLLLIATSASAVAQTVSIVDNELERYFVDEGTDSDGAVNQQMSQADVNAIFDIMIGPQYAMTTSIDLVKFQGLRELRINNASLLSLNLTSLPLLTEVRCDCSALTATTLFNLPQLTGLELLSTQIASIDVSDLTSLWRIGLDFNSNLQNVDLTGLINLEVIGIAVVSGTVTLPATSTRPNVGVSLGDLPDQTEIDLSGFPDLSYSNFFNCPSLQRIDLRNGSNTTIGMVNLGTSTAGFPSLGCFLVDDVSYSTANWTVPDPSVFTINPSDCPTVGFADMETSEVVLYPLPVRSTLFVASEYFEQAAVLDLRGRVVLPMQDLEQNSISLDGLASGVYLVQLLDAEGGCRVQRIVKV